MIGKKVDEWTFKRKMTVNTMAGKVPVSLDKEHLRIDQELLFQRLFKASKNLCNDEIATFSYELCSFPPALFDSQGFPHKAAKDALADLLWPYVSGDSVPEIDQPGIHFIIDGGHLVHKIPWTQSATIGETIQSYREYIQRKYGNDRVTVVFYGYPATPTTKYLTYVIRNGGTKGPRILISDEHTVMKKRKTHFSQTMITRRTSFIFWGLNYRRVGVLYTTPRLMQTH